MSKKIMKYNPAFLSDEQLIDSFVVRHTDLELITDIVRDNVDPSNQHVLVIGPRGIGKTTLVLRVAAGIVKDDELSKQWYPLVFGEESYGVCSPGEFWLEALFHLGRQTKEPRWKKTYKELLEIKDEDTLRESALAQLMDFADEKNKRILLIVENLHQLLGDQISDDEAWTLRHTLQHEPRIMILATATTRFEKIENQGKAMFELFKLHNLKPLDTEDCRKLWQANTGNAFDGELIRPIQILTGGNPRLITIISQCARDISLQNLLDNLIELVDDHTEYFKNHLDNLAPIERKVYLALAEIWEPATAKEVAAAARLEVNKTSSLLGRLIKNGAAVVADDRQRTKKYYVAERMYNIYYLMRRRGGPSSRVKAVIRFLVPFYGHKKTLEIITDEACRLSPEFRRDHYAAYEILLEECSDCVRKELLKSTPDEFIKAEDMPDTLKELFASELQTEFNYKVKQLRLKSTELFEKGDFKEAEKIERQIIDILPDDTSAWSNLGVLLESQNRIQEAEKAYRKIIDIIPNHVNTWYKLGLLLKIQKRYNEAENAFNKVIEIQPDDDDAWISLGLLLADQKRLNKAENAYRKAIEIKPNNVYAWNFLGFLLFNQKRFNEAENAYQKVIEIQPDNFNAIYNLGVSLENQKRYDESENAYLKVIELEPDDVDAWFNLGISLKNLKRYDEAENAFRKVIEKQLDYVSAWINLGILLDNQKRFNEAEHTYRKAIEIQPNHVDAWINLGVSLKNQKRYDEAENAYRKSLEIQPDHIYVWNLLGVLLANQKHYDEAEKAYRKVIEIQPDYIYAWNNLGLLLGDQKIYDEAENAYRKAIDIDPEDLRVWNNLACLFLETKRYEEAEMFARKSVEISPDNSAYQHTLASILVAIGMIDEAFELTKSLINDAEFIDGFTNDVNELIIALAAKGGATQSIEILQESSCAEKLEPLIVGLRLYMGEDERDIRTPLEVLEIGKDVKKRIEDRLAGSDNDEN
jgi:tetratricopeptide (TPR) repeat protein